MDSHQYDRIQWRQDYLASGRVAADAVGERSALGFVLGVLAMLGWGVMIGMEWLLLSAPWNGQHGLAVSAAESLVGVPIVNIVAQLAMILVFPGVASRSVAVPLASIFMLVPWMALVTLQFGGLHLAAIG
jgi:hypothetical protein